MKVKCINDEGYESYLTKDKIYRLVRESEDWYYIVDNNNNLKLKTLVIANRNAYIIENSDNNLVITKTYNNIISTNDNIYLTNATMLNQNDIYLALYNEKDNTSNYNVYIYKLGNTAELINRTYNAEAYPTGFSNFMYLFNDGRNAYISFNLPQPSGNRFYLGLQDDTTFTNGLNAMFDINRSCI